MSPIDPLLQPLRIKNLILKNRIFSAAHLSGMSDARMPAKRYQAYHEEKAKGGLGLTMFGGSSCVSMDSPAYAGQLDVSGDVVIPYFREMADKIHRHGAAIMCQLTHLGRRSTYDIEPGFSLIAPSAVREMKSMTVPRVMDHWDIKRVVNDYAKAARRCLEGGLDGCEISFTSHLVGQFLGLDTNFRDDEYGGRPENRARFGLEVLEAVRRECGSDFIVGIRLYGDERIPEGLDEDACREIAQYYAETGLIDFISVVVSHSGTNFGLAEFMPGMARPIGIYLPQAEAIKKAVKIPVFHSTKIPDLSTARHAISEGIIDLVGMTRAHFADPYIVSKLMRGEEDSIRPCVGATYCSDLRFGGIRCLHNIATGRETIFDHNVVASSGPSKKVVIVGGGPAGLEAARVSVLRGHEVVLFEAADRLGGQINLAARVHWRKDLIGIVDWLAREVERIGVKVRCNIFAEEEDVLSENPDIVIVASGGIPAELDIDGVELATSTWDVLGNPVNSNGTVLVFDFQGEHQAASCAEHMAEACTSVEFVTVERTVGEKRFTAVSFSPHLQKMFEAGITLTTSHELISIKREANQLRATLRHQYSGITSDRIVDQVVIENGTSPAGNIFHELRGRATNKGVLDLEALKENRPQHSALNPDGEFYLFRVGDAVSSRNIHAAMYDSRRLCDPF